jgi:hypothetical protein
MKRSIRLVWFFVLVLLLIQVGGGYVLYTMTAKGTGVPELLMGTLTVFSITTLMTVLFILAAGFSSMMLTDPKQALGLPEGSIRAMIALVLIMVFILISIFLFRKVSLPDRIFMGTVKQASDIRIDSMKTQIILETIPADKKMDDNNYYVFAISEVNEEGKRLAQQLITILGTLVTAISSFYFGNTLTRSTLKNVREELLADQTVTAVSYPEIKNVTPKVGEKGKEIALEIVGTGFKTPIKVQLVRGNETISGTGILSNNTTIHCKIMIDKEPDGKWDIVVMNEDHNQARLGEVFSIVNT